MQKREEGPPEKEPKESEHQIQALSRRERRRIETRERLFEAALRLFSERDFESVTVEMITEAADVGKGTFFNYFESKEAIVAHLFQLQLRQFTEPLRAMLDSVEDSQEPPDPPIHDRVKAIGHQSAEQDRKSKRLMRTLLALSLTNPAVRAANLGIKESATAIVTELVRLQQKYGELRNDIPAETMADLLVHTHYSVLYAWAQSETEGDLHAAMDRAYNLLHEGLYRAEK